MQLAHLEGGHLHYRTRGTGPPLLAVLPRSSGPLGVDPALEHLARHRRVITFDPRGTGNSSPAPAGHDMAGQAADAGALLDDLGIERAALLCHSTGCGAGIGLAAARPGRVSALVLVAPWTHADGYLTTMQNLRKAAARQLHAASCAHFNAAVLFPPAYRRARQEGFDRLAARSRFTPADAEAFAARLDAILAFDARPLLPAIRCPTLVMSAADDQLMPPWFAEEAVAGIAGARHVAFDTGGHMLLETRAEALVDAVLGFLGDAAP